MNTNKLARLMTCSAAIALLSAGTSVYAADCAAPRDMGVRRACEAAAKGGVEGLRRYVEGTRMIYGLNIRDFRNAIPVPVANVEDKTRVVSSK